MEWLDKIIYSGDALVDWKERLDAGDRSESGRSTEDAAQAQAQQLQTDRRASQTGAVPNDPFFALGESVSNVFRVHPLAAFIVIGIAAYGAYRLIK